LVRDLRAEVQAIPDFQSLLDSQVIDRFREFKERLGRIVLHPALLVEVVETNIELKNRFRVLYLDEEARILEDTNKVFEIERYLERNPGVAHEELKRQLDIFRQSRERFDAKRRDNNVKREDIVVLRGSMQTVLESFDSSRASRSPKTLVADDSPGTLVDDALGQLVAIQEKEAGGAEPQASDVPLRVFPEVESESEAESESEPPDIPLGEPVVASVSEPTGAPESVPFNAASDLGPFGPPRMMNPP